MKGVILHILKFYRNCLSPLKLQCCRFYPSCSEYAIESIERHGLFLGFIHTLKRLIRCHPFSSGGYDPVESPAHARGGRNPARVVSSGVK